MLVLAGIAGFVMAQGLPTATLSGKVTTEGDVALPGVTVTVESPQLQGKRETTTSGSGDYNFNLLPPGPLFVTPGARSVVAASVRPTGSFSMNSLL